MKDAFTAMRNTLLTAKLDAYNFDLKSIGLTQQYLSNRKQRE